MSPTSCLSDTHFLKDADCHAAVLRLIGNISGFVYRRRFDPSWTMEFVSSGCRDVTGYDPHRFIANASIAYGDLIARSDWKRVNERIRLAVRHRQRASVQYLIRTAHGLETLVEDRLTPVVNAAGHVLAIEGIIDRARGNPIRIAGPLSPAEEPDHAARSPRPPQPHAS